MSLPKKHRVTAGRAIKLSRVVVSAVFLLMMTALLTALSARVALGLHWVARIQVFPLALAGAVGALVTWFGITMLFGRVYCSSVCPMGTLQDIFRTCVIHPGLVGERLVISATHCLATGFGMRFCASWRVALLLEQGLCPLCSTPIALSGVLPPTWCDRCWNLL